MTVASIDLGHVDIYFDDIAERAVEDCTESDMLVALASENERISRDSGDSEERAFATEAARRLRELAKWFEENQP